MIIALILLFINLNTGPLYQYKRPTLLITLVFDWFSMYCDTDNDLSLRIHLNDKNIILCYC